MIILNALCFLIWCISINARYTVYYSDIRQDSSYPIFDCLYAYLVDHGKETGKPYIQNYHLIPYCRRPDDDYDEEQDEMINPINENIAKTISFKELKEEGVTSEELLKWFASIDVAEKYQMNKNDSDVFHNCSSHWFGSMCQYKFDYDLSLSFSDIIDATFSKYGTVVSNTPGGTCYPFLSGCYRGLWPLCLDWREICDGKIDCMNGEDEEGCGELEMNKCNDNEYRCHYGGQCIPLSFLRESTVSTDCLDGSDERDSFRVQTSMMNPACVPVSTFRCQERIGRYPWSFQCGDGQYLTNVIMPAHHTDCFNKKDRELSRAMLISMDHIPNINCQKAFYCALHFNRTFTGLGKKRFYIIQYLEFISAFF
jgi:hypothetical protein